MSKLNEALTLVRSSNDETKLARWWCELNGWEWPKDLPGRYSEERMRNSGDGLKVMQAIAPKISDGILTKEWEAYCNERGDVPNPD